MDMNFDCIEYDNYGQLILNRDRIVTLTECAYFTQQYVPSNCIDAIKRDIFLKLCFPCPLIDVSKLVNK